MAKIVGRSADDVLFSTWAGVGSAWGFERYEVKMKVDYYTKEFLSWWLPILAIIVVTISLLAFSLGAISDYWNGTAKASLIKKQTGIEYTWREAAQVKNVYDQNNVRIIFYGDEKSK